MATCQCSRNSIRKIYTIFPRSTLLASNCFQLMRFVKLDVVSAYLVTFKGFPSHVLGHPPDSTEMFCTQSIFWRDIPPPTTPFNSVTHQLQCVKILYWNRAQTLDLYACCPQHSWIYRIPSHPSAFSFPRLLVLAYSVFLYRSHFAPLIISTAPLIRFSGSATHFKIQEPQTMHNIQNTRTTFRNEFLNCLSKFNIITV